MDLEALGGNSDGAVMRAGPLSQGCTIPWRPGGVKIGETEL